MKSFIFKFIRSLLRMFGFVNIALSNIFFLFNNLRSISRKVYYFPKMRGGWLDYRVELKFPENITIGNNSVISICTIGAKEKVSIGDDVTISKGAFIETGALTKKGPSRHKAKPIKIGNRVWIAANAIVLGGSVIEDDCLIGAGAVFQGHLSKGSIYSVKDHGS